MMLSKINVSPRNMATLQRLPLLRARSGAARSSAPAAIPAVAAVYSPPMLAMCAAAVTNTPRRSAAPMRRAVSGASRPTPRGWPMLMNTTTSAASAARSGASSIGRPALSAPWPGSISSVAESGVTNQPRQIPTASTSSNATVVTATTGRSTWRITGSSKRLTRPRTPITESPMRTR